MAEMSSVTYSAPSIEEQHMESTTYTTNGENEDDDYGVDEQQYRPLSVSKSVQKSYGMIGTLSPASVSKTITQYLPPSINNEKVVANDSTKPVVQVVRNQAAEVQQQKQSEKQQREGKILDFDTL